MLSKRMQDALNGQINAEVYSAYLYLSMAACLEHLHFPGCAHWMQVQAQEELQHAMKLYEYINACGGRVALNSVETPPAEWASPLAVFEDALQHEQKVTELIHTLVDLAGAERDYATNVFLHWFVAEQVQEEAAAHEIVQKLQRMGEVGTAVYLIDRELAGRSLKP